jgi:hypothetical protein
VSQSPAFVGDLSSAFAATQARLAEDALFNSSGVTGTVSGHTTEVPIGTLSVRVGAAPTVFEVDPYRFAPTGFGGSGLDGNTLSWLNNLDFDVTNNGAGSPPYTGADAFVGATTFSVQAVVPEPGTGALVLVAAWGAGVGALARRWRNRARASA